jgi:hypothetical protein
LQQNSYIRCIYDLDAVFSVGLKIKGDALAVGRPCRRSMVSGVERELEAIVPIWEVDPSKKSIAILSPLAVQSLPSLDIARS